MILGLSIIRVFVEGNLFVLAIASYLVMAIGKGALQGEVKALLAGQAVGLSVLLIWLTGAIGSDAVQDAGDLLNHVCRAGIAAVFVTGTAWLVLFPIVVAWSSHRRARAWEWMTSYFEGRIRKPAGYLDYQPDTIWDRRSPPPEDTPESTVDLSDASPDERQQLLFELQLRYDIHCDVLKGAYPEERLKSRTEDYLNEAVPIQVVRERVAGIQNVFDALIRQAETVEETGNFESVEEAVTHFQSERDRILQMDLDEETLESLLVSFEEARDIALEEFIKGLNKRR